jgi:hypothetical protein
MSLLQGMGRVTCSPIPITCTITYPTPYCSRLRTRHEPLQVCSFALVLLTVAHAPPKDAEQHKLRESCSAVAGQVRRGEKEIRAYRLRHAIYSSVAKPRSSKEQSSTFRQNPGGPVGLHDFPTRFGHCWLASTAWRGTDAVSPLSHASPALETKGIDGGDGRAGRRRSCSRRLQLPLMSRA